MTGAGGLPASALLWLFIAVSAAVTAATLVQRHRIFRGAVCACPQEPLPPAHVGYLVGGPMRAMEASLTLLSRSGAVDIDQDSGKVHRVGPLPTEAGRLEGAMLDAARRRLRLAQMPNQRPVASALVAIRQDLQRRGLLLGADTKRAARRGGWLMLLLLGTGLAGLINGTIGGPVLAMALVLLAPLTLAVLVRTRKRTRAADTLLASLKREHRHLEQSFRPAWQTYGAATTALAVGLFGLVVMWETDPALAMSTMLPASHLHTSSIDGGGGCGGCGAGGCGGGCGCGG